MNFDWKPHPYNLTSLVLPSFYRAEPVKKTPVELQTIATQLNLPLAAVRDAYKQAYREPIFRNGDDPDNYQVAVNPIDSIDKDAPQIIWLSVKLISREPIHDWRHLQEIKNMIVGPEFEAMEMYPAESRVVDSANQYHIWVVNDETFRWPWGFRDSFKSFRSVGGSKQRRFAHEL